MFSTGDVLDAVECPYTHARVNTHVKYATGKLITYRLNSIVFYRCGARCRRISTRSICVRPRQNRYDNALLVFVIVLLCV
jgi:hypothetical protein